MKTRVGSCDVCGGIVVRYSSGQYGHEDPWEAGTHGGHAARVRGKDREVRA